MATKAVKSDAERELAASFFSVLPVIPSERIWGYAVFTATCFSITVATWSFLVGGAIGQFVGAKMAIGVTAFGTLPFFILMAMSVMPCFWYGLDPFIVARSIFGRHGAALPLIALLTSGMGWITMVEIMFGKAVVELAKLMGLVLEGWPYTALFIGFNLLFCFLVWLITWKGPLVIKYTNLIISPVLLIILVWMFWTIIADKGWGGLAAVVPPSASGDLQLDGVIGFELMVGLTWSWWPFAGVWPRLARGSGIAFHGTIWGSGSGFVLGVLLASFAGLAVGAYDPTLWMAATGGVVFAIGALIFVAFANILSDVGQLYPVGVAVQHWGVFQRMKWPLIIAIFMIPAISISWVDPDTYFSLMGSFLIYNSVLFCPITAIFIVDFWILRRRRLEVREIYKPKGIYHFYGGFNPATIIAWIIGVIVYVSLLNPVSLSGPDIFKYISASGPSFIATFVVYWLLVKVWLIPAGVGGYKKQQGLGAVANSVD